MGMNTRGHSGREMHVLVGLLEDKIEDLGEQYLRGLNAMLWGDGTADALGFAGIQSIVVDAPATGTVGGIDRATDAWWRNRAAAWHRNVAGKRWCSGADAARRVSPASPVWRQS